MTKNTYGTGSFVLVNLGPTHPAPVDGLLTTIAWQLGEAVTYAMEGSIFVTGAAVQWLRDGLGLIDAAADAGPLAESVEDTGGVVLVPAFTGLGAPWFDPHARGAMFGLTRGTTRAHVVRAVLESMAWQTADVVDAITAAAGIPVTELRVDGGASAMDVLCRFQADVLGVPVRRPANLETTVLGAAFLAGIAEDVWSSPADAAASWREASTFLPQPLPHAAERRADWRRGVDRTRGWTA
jgi:glycerol kinase